MLQDLEIVFRATAISGVMTNFLERLKDIGVCHKAIGVQTAELTLRISATPEATKEILEIWRDFASYYRYRIAFLEPEIRSMADDSVPLGPDD